MTATETPGLQTDLLRLLHRAKDGWACFCRKSPKFQQVVSLLPNQFDRLTLDNFANESYFTINSMIRPGEENSLLIPDLPAGHRDNESVRYFNAAFTDLDGYKVGFGLSQDQV